MATRKTLGELINLCGTKLVDFVGIGDSNQAFGGYGFDHAWQYGLGLSYNMYGTGLGTGMENGGSGAGFGYTYTRASPSGTQLTTTLPASLNSIWDIGAGTQIHMPGYSASTNVTVQLGIITSTGGKLDVTHALKFEFDYATFDSGAGSFPWQIRLGASPYTSISSGTINTNTGSIGWVTGSQSIAADAGRSGLSLNYFTIKNAGTAVAPVAFLWQNVIDTDATTGYRYTTLVYRGGQSLRTMAYDLQQLSDGTLSHLFSRIRSRQVELGQSVNVIFTINSGVNDRNETLASVGPLAVTPGDSTAAYTDNMTAIRNRVRGIWAQNGWALSEIHFMMMVSHPISSPDDSEMIAYRSALLAWAETKEDCTAIDLSSLTTFTALNGGGYYDAGGNAHLTQSGYEYVGSTVVSAMKSAGAIKTGYDQRKTSLIPSLIGSVIS